MKAAPVAERNVLADAVSQVEKTPWPKPQNVSFISRITGGGDNDRVTKDDAVAAYLAHLEPAGARFQQLQNDAGVNLNAAAQLERAALNALSASRLSMNDVTLIETAIRALRENRQIYSDAAKELEKAGEPVSEDAVDAMRDDYRQAIKNLGETADILSEEIARDSTKTFARPVRVPPDIGDAKNLSDL